MMSTIHDAYYICCVLCIVRIIHGPSESKYEAGKPTVPLLCRIRAAIYINKFFIETTTCVII